MSSLQFTTHTSDSYASILQVDDTNILLDCGAEIDASNVHVILLSHATAPHIRKLVAVYKKYSLDCPIYATIPTQILGQISAIDQLLSIRSSREFDEFSVQDIDDVFDRIIVLRYSQPVSLPDGIVVTPFPAGHTVGGTIWKIKKDMDDIIYAVDYNHRKEMHINASVIHLGLPQLTRPRLLITDANNVNFDYSPRKAREAALMESLQSTLKDDGSVLIPINPVRILELAYALDNFWTASRLSYPIYYLSQTGKTMTAAKNLLEWFGDSIMDAFSQRREVPFDLTHVKTIVNLEEMGPGPKVVLCTSETLMEGHAFDLIFDMSMEEKNLILLIDHLNDEKYGRKVPLQGDELEQYNLSKQKEQEAETTQSSLLKRLNTNDIESDEEELEASNPLHDIYDVYLKNNNKVVGFFKQSWSFKMFPVFDQRKQYDDYGHEVRKELFETEDTEQKTEIPQPEKEEIVEIPGRYIEEERELILKCKLLFLDFEGRIDGASIKNVVTQIEPKKMVMTFDVLSEIIINGANGDDDLTRKLKDQMTESNIETFAPLVNQTINVSYARSHYTIQLSDDFLSATKMVSHGDYAFSFVSSKVIDSMLVPLPRARPNLMFGDVKLSALRKKLNEKGHSTELSQGVLYLVEHGLVVRKSSKGKLVIEGSFGPKVRKVRQLIYDLMVTV